MAQHISHGSFTWTSYDEHTHGTAYFPWLNSPIAVCLRLHGGRVSHQHVPSAQCDEVHVALSHRPVHTVHSPLLLQCQQGDWDAALSHCTTSAQRDEVHVARADAAMASGDLSTAAVHYARVLGGVPPFEDIALK